VVGSDDDELDAEVEAALNGPLSEQTRFVIDLVASLNLSDPEMFLMTPVQVIDSIVQLDGRGERFFLDAGFATLTEYVREVSRLDDRPVSDPLFGARSTGKDRLTQHYQCHLTPEGCPAFFKIKMHSWGMELGDHQFQHDHDVYDAGERRAYHSIRPEAIQEIIEMTRRHATPGQIRSALDLGATCDVLYASRRATLMEQRQNQVRALKEACATWRGWAYWFVGPEDGEFQGFFAVHTHIIGHPMCRDTLGMDDTSCTNFFELPVPAIITPDPNDTTQVVAFAILRDHGADALIEFLEYVKTHMKQDQPKAFIIDRAAAEILAIRTAFPKSYICFCLMHVFRNLQEKCGKKHAVVTEFWPAMRGDFHKQQDYRKLLYDTYLANRGRPEKKGMVNCVARVFNDFPHIAPCMTSAHTSMDQTSRNEAFNGVIKVFLDHRLMDLLYVANAYRLMAEVALRRSQHMLTRFIPFGILSRRDQHFVGRVALEMILDQMTYFRDHRRKRSVVEPEYDGHCCTCHTRYPDFPCCHLLRDRYAHQRQQAKPRPLPFSDFLQDDFRGAPLLALSDIPRRWHRILTLRPPPVNASPPFVRHEQAPRDLAAAKTFLEQVVLEAEDSPELLEEIFRWRHRVERRFRKEPLVDPLHGASMADSPEHNPDGPVDGSPPAGPAVFQRDPPLRDEPGAPMVHPRRRSPMDIQKGGR
jgi:hypothetical protein